MPFFRPLEVVLLYSQKCKDISSHIQVFKKIYHKSLKTLQKIPKKFLNYYPILYIKAVL